jgi:hypothetical protein
MDNSMTAGDWLKLALRRDIVSRSVRVGLVVGTLLAVINHGDRLLSADIDMTMLWKIILSYLVPYSVSTWASVQSAHRPKAPD